MQKNQTKQAQKTGEQLRDAGIRKATDSANEKVPSWADKAFEFLRNFIRNKDVFMVEDVRNASVDTVETPPSGRAWGGVILRAKRAGLIQSKGFRCVNNPLAHRTPATLWQVT